MQQAVGRGCFREASKWGFLNKVAHLGLFGFEGDEAAAVGAGEREDHLQAPRAQLGPQALQPQAAACQHVCAQIRPRHRRPHDLHNP